MDGLDALLAEASSEREERQQYAERKVELVHEAAKRSQQRSQQLAAVQQARSHATAPSPAEQRYAAYLKRYLQRLLDPHELDAIAANLDCRSYSELVAYYEADSKLADYTITQAGITHPTARRTGDEICHTASHPHLQELSRMDYQVRRPDGATVSDRVAIQDLYHSTQGSHQSSEDPAHLLWRMSNQSLLADFIAVL